MKSLNGLIANCLARVSQYSDYLVTSLNRPNLDIIEVSLDKCVHYCGFRYGGQEYNPYETYQIELCRGTPLHQVRRRFIDFVRFYRPRHFGDALGLSLSRPYPLWRFPWDFYYPREPQKNDWRQIPDECPDILTHFCDAGISSVKIDEEFFWLERAVRLIAEYGYHPEKYGYPQILEFQGKDGSAAYLLLDGNHRAGALTALQYSETIAANRRMRVCEDDLEKWPAVHRGLMSREDALAVFHAYFRGNPPWIRSETPARILAPLGWEELYFIDVATPPFYEQRDRLPI
jgi:hypothetical protein